MKHCPNPACSHARAVGSAAEYVVDRATCSDCDAALEDGPAPSAPEGSAAAPASLWGRLAITLAAVPALLVLQRIVLPGVDPAAVAQLMHPLEGARDSAGGPSVVALGIMPLISAAVLVQLAALIVPAWRPLRWSSAGRARLHKATLFTTLALCVLQGYWIVRFLESLPTVGADIQRLVVWPTLVAGTFLLIALGAFLSKHGLGNGVAAILVASSAPPMLAKLVEKLTADDGTSAAQRVLLLVLPVAFAVATGYTLTSHRRARGPHAEASDERAAPRYREAPERALSPVIRAPASGILPITLVASILALVDIFSMLGFQTSGLQGVLLRLDDTALILLTVGAAVVLAFLFHPLDRLVERWSRGLRRRDDRERVREELQRERRRAVLWSAAFTGGLMLIQALSGTLAMAAAGPLSVALLTAITMDFLAEWRARREGGELVEVRSEDDVGAADAAMRALASEAIPVHARGIYLRTLLQVMGPYVPVELMVPAARAEDATALLRERFPD